MAAQSSKLDRLVQYIEEYAPTDGIHPCLVKDFGVIRMSATHAKAHTCYEPILLVVGQGEKYCYVGEEKYNYSAGHILTMFLPMPVQTEIVHATPDKPFLAAGLRMDLGRLADILLRMERVDGDAIDSAAGSQSGVFSAPLDRALLDAILRLFEAAANPTDAAILGELIVDEIYYRLLRDEQRGDLRTLLQQRGQLQRISKAVSHIHANLDKPVSVENLADMVHMSRTTFHENFKAVMHVSPLQYAKSMKLHRAQTLIQEGRSAGEAGYAVGYNSPAQFSREYKRHFGYAPSATTAMV